MSGAYRDATATCARCGKVITSEIAVSLPWAPYAFMCGSLGSPYCFDIAEKDMKRLYGQPATVTKHVISLGMENWPWFACGVGVLGLVCMLGYAIFCAVAAPDRVNHCYTFPDEKNVLLYGQVDWHDDRKLGDFETFDQAVEGAHKIGCPLNMSSDGSTKELK